MLKSLHICFAADNMIVKPLSAAIASVLVNNKEHEISIYVLSHNISTENQKKIAQLQSIRPFKLQFLSVELEEFQRFLVSKSIPIPAYFRYKIPTIFEHLDRVLYLDCDVIVCSDLTELWDIDFAGNYIAGVEDITSSYHVERVSLISDVYINSGVILFNIPLCNKINLSEKLFEATDRYRDSIRWYDQDVINIVCDGKVKILDEKWNYQYSVDLRHKFDPPKVRYYIEPMKNPAIIHYISSYKPWKYFTRTTNTELYWRYFTMTPWKHEYTWLVRLCQYIKRILVRRQLKHK